MGKNANVELESYNNFCKQLSEGSVLYNVDLTNGWGEYLLVISKSTVKIGDKHTYSLLLLGLEKKRDRYLPRNFRVSLTPDSASHFPYLKYIGYCKFDLQVILRDMSVNIGLAVAYGNTDLHKFTKKMAMRKPQKKKYGKDGKLVIKKLNNN